MVAKIEYQKPLFVKVKKMTFPVEIMQASGRTIVCKQCSSCHACR